jgi:uncharacterized protein YutE (UPF0331/DUF86 family)
VAGFVPDDVILGKVAIIERCLARVERYYRGRERDLESDFMLQDAILLNLQRAAEAAIDLAMHVVRSRRLGLPRESREAFALLHQGGLIDADVTRRMQSMVGFRNIAVHDYRKLDLAIVRAIIEERSHDFLVFTGQMLKLAGLESPGAGFDGSS